MRAENHSSMERHVRRVDWSWRMAQRMCTVVNVFLLCVIGSFTGVGATKCYKVESVGEREGNIYFCEESDKDECCNEDGEPTCCEPQAFKTVREQLILWGSLAAVLLLIVGLCCYFWKDFYCCKDDTPLSKKCCRCCKTESDDRDDLTPEPRDAKSYSPQQWPSTSSGAWPPAYTNSQYEEDDMCESPAPPFQFTSPKDRDKY